MPQLSGPFSALPGGRAPRVHRGLRARPVLRAHQDRRARPVHRARPGLPGHLRPEARTRTHSARCSSPSPGRIHRRRGRSPTSRAPSPATPPARGRTRRSGSAADTVSSPTSLRPWGRARGVGRRIRPDPRTSLCGNRRVSVPNRRT
ncbi:Putative S-adenosyl-L-methionine-dependent methyl transferase [Mycobacterium intracellulare subsp. intracellulare MTCC 9506]|uniref:Putative S-adenosyl-L-methionine-dependent methyl transferase n=1 Tax=Mycobacterium indicus pranii (strain DSM 45239 / MTCC 9506) TaxID=1232724 RepID=J9WCX0_MYCIP|nr:Putative S-adenosyl-L-methionine-dependent methyl transferase [Mycobacterium intracellulare subsp. intracellulare MTCC 9506]